MIKSILTQINLLANGDSWARQQIIFQIVHDVYKEDFPNKGNFNHLCHLEPSDFIVLGDLLESLIKVRMSNEAEASYCYINSRKNLEGQPDSELVDDVPF